MIKKSVESVALANYNKPKAKNCYVNVIRPLLIVKFCQNSVYGVYNFNKNCEKNVTKNILTATRYRHSLDITYKYLLNLATSLCIPVKFIRASYTNF